jgi:hypothetical protein
LRAAFSLGTTGSSLGFHTGELRIANQHRAAVATSMSAMMTWVMV